MRALVVDASVLVAALTTSTDAEWAESSILGAEALVAPHLAIAETANILRRARASGKLDPMEATAAYRDLILLDLELLPFAPFAKRIWELAAALTVYDAWYVAVAEALGAPLATLDRRLARASGPRCAFHLPS